MTESTSPPAPRRRARKQTPSSTGTQAKAKATGPAKLKVSAVGRFPIYCHKLGVTVPAGSILEVLDDPWIRRQIELRVLKEV